MRAAAMPAGPPPTIAVEQGRWSLPATFGVAGGGSASVVSVVAAMLATVGVTRHLEVVQVRGALMWGGAIDGAWRTHAVVVGQDAKHARHSSSASVAAAPGVACRRLVVVITVCTQQ